MANLSPLKKNRSSNIELLRIVCMFFIVLHHFMAHTVYHDAILGNAIFLNTDIVPMMLNAFLVVGVNCFLLISGYFSIQFSWKGFLNLYLLMAFYVVVADFAHLSIVGGSIGKSLFLYAFFPFTYGGLWFMTCYLILYCLSPLLNKAIDGLQKRDYMLVLGLLIFMNVYFGFFRHSLYINSDGCTVAQCILMYMLAGYMKKFLSIETILSWRRYSMIVYIVCSIVVGLFAICIKKWGLSGIRSFQYNNPLIISASIGFFLVFLSFEFKNRFVNYIAGSAVAAYLLQDCALVSADYYGIVADFCSRYSGLFQLGWIFLISLAFFAFAIMFDKIRMLGMKLVWKLYAKFVER